MIKNKKVIKTWHKELFIVSIILCTTNFLFANNLVNWLTTLAVLFTFQHAQIGDRLQERQRVMSKPDVHCYWKLNWLFGIKEVLWITVFVLIGNWAAIIGSGTFAVYPIWRKYYRSKIKPLKMMRGFEATINMPGFEKCNVFFVDENNNIYGVDCTEKQNKTKEYENNKDSNTE